MRKNISKKGAVELSLNLIIMLIIGMVVLGLVISFVTKLVGDASGNLGAQIGDAEQKMIDSLLEESGYFGVAPQNLEIPAGGSAKFFVKINNLGTNDLIIADLTETSTPVAIVQKPYVAGGCTFTVISPSLTILSKDTQVLTVILEAPKTTCSIGDESFVNVVFEVGTSIKDTVTLNAKVVAK